MSPTVKTKPLDLEQLVEERHLLKKLARQAHRDAHRAVFEEINRLLTFDKTKQLITLLHRLEAAARHHGRMMEREEAARRALLSKAGRP
jgi:hypothetical protein